jgi:hypothetical protein
MGTFLPHAPQDRGGNSQKSWGMVQMGEEFKKLIQMGGMIQNGGQNSPG